MARFLCTLLGSVPLGVLVLSSDGSCVAANATLCSLSLPLAGGHVNLVGTPIRFDTPELRAAFARAMAGEEVLVETQSPPAELSLAGLWRLHFRPFHVNDERGVAVFFEDVAEYQSRGGDPLAIDERFRLLVELAADGILIHRAQILLYLNAEAVLLLGYDSPDQLVGRSIPELLEPDYRGEFAARLRAVAAGQSGAQVFETAFLRRGGESFAAECRAANPPADEMGTGFLFVRDISERKLMQRRRENASRVETLARFSMTIGSELHAYVTELRRWLTRAASRAGVAVEQHAELAGLADSMAERANGLLLSQAPNPNKHSASSSTLEDLVVRICSALRSERLVGDRATAAPIADGNSSDLLIDLEPASYVVKGDICAMEAGLTVLARIALRSRTRPMPLWIRGSRAKAPDGTVGPSYCLTFGGGRSSVASSLLRMVTERRADVLRVDSWEEGRDLELLGGYFALLSQGCSVDVHACANGECTFEVELPLDLGRPIAGADDHREGEVLPNASDPVSDARAASDFRDGSPDTERSGGIAMQLATQRSPAPILICDDEARLAALTAGLLREYGFVVMTVQRGIEAVRAVETHPIDVVVLDVNLPGEDARDIVAKLRSRSRASVILSSGYTEEDIDPALLQDVAVKAFLAKPYGVELLVSTIERVRTEAPGAVQAGDGSE